MSDPSALEDEMYQAAGKYINDFDERKLKKQGNKDVWVTKNGKKIRFKDLDDRHLLNILGMLQRKGQAAKEQKDVAFLSMTPPRGDMAQMAFEQECDNQWRSTWADFVHEQFDGLLAEAERRGLQDLSKFYLIPMGGAVPYKPKN